MFRNGLSWIGSSTVHRLLMIAGLVLTSLASWHPATAGTHPHMRHGWIAGVGAGGGTAGVSVADSGSVSTREGGVAASVRAGYAFNQRLSLELGGTGWSKEQSGQTITFTATMATLNYYPGGEGLVLRAGVGTGSGEAKFQSGSVSFSATERGLGVMGGAGYEFRVTPRFALGPQIHVSWINLDSFNANWVSFELGFNWYFFKR